MKIDKAHKQCSGCETKYTVTWDIDEQDLDPLTCPFCGYEVEHEEDTDEVWTNEHEEEDNDWN